MAGGIILSLTYGIDVQDGEDPFVNLIEGANANFNAATVPGAFLVDFFPLLRRLPEWLPGMGFMRTARKWAKDTAAMVEVPYAFTEEQMVRTLFSPFSFVYIHRHLGRRICSFLVHLQPLGERRQIVSGTDQRHQVCCQFHVWGFVSFSPSSK